MTLRSKRATRRQLDPAFDRHLGSLLRTRRHQLGWSQQQLADRLGLTFQQVQKYENGRNQISVARLVQISQVVETPITYFLQGDTTASALSKIDYSMARTIAAIPSDPVKAALLRLAHECRRFPGVQRATRA
jgi:transcriptional regulator with XRE-family HTH domain